MAEQSFIELRQEDVFSYIDKDLKKERVSKRVEFTQKTKRNFLLVFVIDLIAVVIAVGGFFVVYNIFKASEYKLVGTEGSIKGLEDVLYKELQKKANMDLEKKQKELEETRSKYNELTSQLDNLKVEQQKQLKTKYDQLQADLLAKMNNELKNSTAQQRDAIQKKYEDELKARQSDLQLEAKKKEDDLKKQMDAERDKLNSLSSAKEKELQSAKAELDKANQEFKNQMVAESSKSKQAIADLNSQLEEKQRLEAFNAQVNLALKSAIDSYNKKQYNTVFDKFTVISNLYENQSKGIAGAQDRKNVDYFLMSQVDDYLNLKNSPYVQDKQKNEDKLAAIQSLNDFGKELKKGEYKEKIREAEIKTNQLYTKLPEVFSFYDGLNDFGRYIDDVNSENSLKSANDYFYSKAYDKATTNYIDTLKQFPEMSDRNTILDRVLYMFSGAPQLNIDEVNKKAEPLYTSAVSFYNNNSYDQAISKFQDLLLTYPNSKFTKDAVDYLQKCHEAKITMMAQGISSNTTVIELKRLEQNKNAEKLYADAGNDEKGKQYDSAKTKYERIVLDDPLSDYIGRSVEGIERAITAKLRAGTYTVQTAGYLKASIGKIVDNLGGEVVIYLDKSEGLSMGSTVYIYRKETPSDFRYIGDAVISEMSPVMTKATIVKRNEDVHVGDLIYKK